MGKHSRVARHRIERPGNAIGRVGALALFLGVGGALASLPATASADTGTNDSTAAPSRGVRGDASQHAARTTRPAGLAAPAAA